MKYKELVLLGFTRRDYYDSVHFDEYGFQAFEMMKNLGKRHKLHWDVTAPKRGKVTEV